MHKEERDLRIGIIEACRDMETTGLNQGSSGNISARYRDRMLITPSAMSYQAMEPEMIASVALDNDDLGDCEGPLKPSSEWRFHHDLLKARPDISFVLHAHSLYCTSLAMARMDIPSCHYMVAAFGGNNVRCSPYATYGTKALSRFALTAMEDRSACLLANHGMIVVGNTLTQTMWRAGELETIAHQYCISLQLGGPVLLSDAEMADVHAGFASYGLQEEAA